MAQRFITIVDEDPGQLLGSSLKSILLSEPDYEVALVASVDGVKRQRGPLPQPILVLPVLSPNRKRAGELLEEVRAAAAGSCILPVVPLDTSANDVLDDLLSSQIEDFLATPFKQAEVVARVRRMLPPEPGRPDLRSEELINRACGLAQLVGQAPSFLALKRRIALAAQYDSLVLLTGETGSGKERCARALHYLSSRADKPFLPINCGAVPVDLFENELYGHQKGAFTGALASQPGLIQEAEGGTLFLDEIETLTPANQVKLLRFLQDKTYYPLGSPKSKQADVWIIASSNVNLLQKAKDGSFREDLFYRLAVITLELPALRERRTDVPLLAAHFLNLHGAKYGWNEKRISPTAMDALCGYSWPGNVRELENVIQQIIVFSESKMIEPQDIPLPRPINRPQAARVSFKERKAEAVDQFNRAFVADMLETYKGNVTHAARATSMDRRALGRLIKKYRDSSH